MLVAFCIFKIKTIVKALLNESSMAEGIDSYPIDSKVMQFTMDTPYADYPAGNAGDNKITVVKYAFEEKDIVTKTNWMGDGTLVYELNKGEHTHYAVCLNCHKRIPLHVCPFEHMHVRTSKEETGLEQEDFVVTGHKLELYGYCGKCRKSLKGTCE